MPKREPLIKLRQNKIFKASVIYIFIISILVIASFIIWHFFFSIYEVKFSTNVNGHKLLVNSNYYIELLGINSFGNGLEFRRINPQFEIIKGDGIINDCKIQKNKLTFHTTSKIGYISFLIKTDYSLNPLIFNFSVISKD